jgi:tetratricopeptide (TPR) repeat protein
MTRPKKDFWRKVTDDILDHDTQQLVAEQKAALAKNPDWAEGHYHLAQLYRVQQKRAEAKEQLFLALEKKPTLADAHIALGEIYIAEDDLERARVHAQFAAQLGKPRLLEQLQRHNAL